MSQLDAQITVEALKLELVSLRVRGTVSGSRTKTYFCLRSVAAQVCPDEPSGDMAVRAMLRLALKRLDLPKEHEDAIKAVLNLDVVQGRRKPRYARAVQKSKKTKSSFEKALPRWTAALAQAVLELYAEAKGAAVPHFGSRADPGPHRAFSGPRQPASIENPHDEKTIYPVSLIAYGLSVRAEMLLSAAIGSQAIRDALVMPPPFLNKLQPGYLRRTLRPWDAWWGVPEGPVKPVPEHERWLSQLEVADCYVELTIDLFQNLLSEDSVEQQRVQAWLARRLAPKTFEHLQAAANLLLDLGVFGTEELISLGRQIYAVDYNIVDREPFFNYAEQVEDAFDQRQAAEAWTSWFQTLSQSDTRLDRAVLSGVSGATSEICRILRYAISGEALPSVWPFAAYDAFASARRSALDVMKTLPLRPWWTVWLPYYRPMSRWVSEATLPAVQSRFSSGASDLSLGIDQIAAPTGAEGARN